ncbi:hypothetical protein C8R43DRAFT_1118650 [Mycena crocata]|nr:hypothetical protein C8R43DRAFT_1118650 [Mycena crocata]
MSSSYSSSASSTFSAALVSVEAGVVVGAASAITNGQPRAGNHEHLQVGNHVGYLSASGGNGLDTGQEVVDDLRLVRVEDVGRESIPVVKNLHRRSRRSTHLRVVARQNTQSAPESTNDELRVANRSP